MFFQRRIRAATLPVGAAAARAVRQHSHDLRTPLTSLHGYLETLLVKSELSEADQRRSLEIALGQSAKVGRLAQELFDLARLQIRRAPAVQPLFSTAGGRAGGLGLVIVKRILQLHGSDIALLQRSD